jgi:hypothetical protein
MAFAKTFEIGDFGKSRDTTEVEVFNPIRGPSSMAASRASRVSGLVAGLAPGSCTIPFTATKLGAAQGSVSMMAAGAPSSLCARLVA